MTLDKSKVILINDEFTTTRPFAITNLYKNLFNQYDMIRNKIPSISHKQQNNDLCKCESGLKYKKCCKLKK